MLCVDRIHRLILLNKPVHLKLEILDSWPTIIVFYICYKPVLLQEGYAHNACPALHNRLLYVINRCCNKKATFTNYNLTLPTIIVCYVMNRVLLQEGYSHKLQNMLAHHNRLLFYEPVLLQEGHAHKRTCP
jgi:hypothetical protein